MSTASKNLPVIDFHCDLLSYLESTAKADPFNTEDIGCSFPAMKEGNVVLQVMAIYSATEKGSVASALKQGQIFKELLTKYPNEVHQVRDAAALDQLGESSSVGMVAAIENASGLCEEDQPLGDTFRNLEKVISDTGRVLYIGLTHHAENRFGGGNYSEAGLKDDGKALLDYIDGRKIAIDFSHTSDVLAYGIVDHVDKNNLDIPLIASHSNYRAIFKHPRNLPNDLAQELVRRKGLIGLNFVRAFVNQEDPEVLFDHLNHGLMIGAENAITFGADYFHAGLLGDPSRAPYYFEEHKDASSYPAILKEFSERTSQDLAKKLASENAIGFLRRIWS